MSVTAALAWFGLNTLAIVGFSIMHTYATRGFAFGFSSNRVPGEKGKIETRIGRILQNQTEAAAYVVPILLAVHFAGLGGTGVDRAALLIVVGRAAFALLYLSGIPFIRVPAFLFVTLSCLYLLLRLAGML